METLTPIQIGKTTLEAIEALKENAKNSDNFVSLLTESLQTAKSIAEKSLSNALFNALKWPINVIEYIEYLEWFRTWIPKQSSNPAWTDPGTDNHQEVYDHLCHFYYLIDQPVGTNKDKVVQNIPWFSQWLVTYANMWGDFLNTTDSFNDEVLNSFITYSPQYQLEDYMVNGKPNNPSGWLTFNQFFAREINPGLRPITEPYNNYVITSPADCTFRQIFPIQSDSSVQEVTVKKTHTFGNIKDLLKGSKYADEFASGTFVHYFLGPYSYHRFHTPVSGTLKECYPVQGKVFLDVNITDGQFDAPDGAETGYEFNQARGVVVIDTKDSPYGDVGLVAIIPVGMCQVSSVNMTAVTNREVLKGDEFGYFLFGGSDIIVLYQQGKKPLVDQGNQYRHFGTPIAYIPQT